MKKYEFVPNDRIQCGDITLTRIRALIDIPRFNVSAGDLGGYIHTEDNLSQHDDCWVFETAKVYGNFTLRGNSHIYTSTRVFDCFSIGDGTTTLIDSQTISENCFTAINCGPDGKHTLTMCKTETGIELSCGAFVGTPEQFIDEIAWSGDDQTYREYRLLVRAGESILKRKSKNEN